MGLSRMQGTSGYISYFGSNEGKRTRFNCDHYHRFAECCFRNKKIEPCKSPGRCKYHTENPSAYLVEVKKETRLKGTKKQSQKTRLPKPTIVNLGNRVEILNLTTFERRFVTVVDPREVNHIENKISRTSLLGQNLLKRPLGKTIRYRFDGQIQQYKIMNIE